MGTSSLTDMQKRYIWLMGSFDNYIMVQGRGYRSARLMYALREDELVIFGYSNPPLWLKSRGLIKPLQLPNSYDLTDAGRLEYQRMLVRGDGLWINKQIREVS